MDRAAADNGARRALQVRGTDLNAIEVVEKAPNVFLRPIL
jgi:hypothetical protein